MFGTYADWMLLHLFLQTFKIHKLIIFNSKDIQNKQRSTEYTVTGSTF